MPNFKPIRIIAEMEISSEQILLATSSITHFLNLVGATSLVSVDIDDLVDLRVFYVDYPNEQRVVDGKAAVGYLFAKGYSEDYKFINLLLARGLIAMDLDGGQSRVIPGFSIYNQLGAVSVGYEGTPFNMMCEWVVIIHELGHIYGAPSKERLSPEWVEKFNLHCPNECVMTYDVNEIIDKIDLVNKPFCDACLQDLKNYFKKGAVKI